MLSYCLKCRKIQKVEIQKLQRLNTEQKCFYQIVQWEIIKFIKEQETRGLLLTGIKVPILSDLPIANILL